MGVKEFVARASLVVLWLRLCASIAGGTGSIPGWGTKMQCCVAKEKKEFVTILKPHHMYPLPFFFS